ncbi:MAG: hypothetical protein ACFB9N_04445 [Geitlerinemataceae cyanobacterium]
MARYTATFTVIADGERIYQIARDLLDKSGFRPLHESRDYVMSSEVPGSVKFSLLTTAEVLIDVERDRSAATLILLVKNEELPLSKVNHCKTTFDRLQSEILGCSSWKAILKASAT